MTTTKKLYVVAGVAGLLIALQAVAADATADRHYLEAQARGASHEQARQASREEPGAQAQAGARPAQDRMACSCGHATR